MTAVAQASAVVYRRVSTTEQATEAHTSLAIQQGRAEACCADQGLDRVATFTDVASGQT
jgi:DNA invertase Pin-like site-specific DNA recombinase